jgi:nucleolar protein 6
MVVVTQHSSTRRGMNADGDSPRADDGGKEKELHYIIPSKVFFSEGSKQRSIRTEKTRPMSAHLTKRRKKGLAFRQRFKSKRSPPPAIPPDASLMEDPVVVEGDREGDEEGDVEDVKGMGRVVLESDPFRRDGIRPSKRKRKEREEDDNPRTKAKRKRLKKDADDGLVALDTGLGRQGTGKQVEQGGGPSRKERKGLQEAGSQALTAKSEPGHEHKQRFILFVGTIPYSFLTTFSREHTLGNLRYTTSIESIKAHFSSCGGSVPYALSFLNSTRVL